MGQWRQVTTGAHRAFFRHAGVDAQVDQADQRVDQLQPDAGKPPGEAVDFQHHHQAHGTLIHKLADAGGVGEHNAGLQRLELLIGNAGVGQQAEAGVDAVNYAVFGQRLVDTVNAAGDGRIAGRVQLDLHRVATDFAQIVQGQFAGGNDQLNHDFALRSAWADPARSPRRMSGQCRSRHRRDA